MSEVMVTVMIMMIVAMMVQSKFSGVKSATDIDVLAAKLDSKASQLMVWASGQEDFSDDGTRASSFAGNGALALTAKTTKTPLSDWVLASSQGESSANDYVPSDSKIAFAYNIQGDGEHIRLSQCRDGDPSTRRICLRIDLYPWGNTASGDQPVTYRSIECIGTACSGSPSWTAENCRIWVKGEQVLKNPAGVGTACPVDNAADSNPQTEDGLAPYTPAAPETGGPWPLKVSTSEGGTVSSGSQNGGSFSKDGILDCPTDPSKCSSTFSNNAQITLKAIPDNGYSFVGWSGAACASDQICTVNMGQAWDVSARFVLTTSINNNYQQITVSAGANHTCATDTVSAVYCWGLNNKGQLGDGTTSSKGTPNAVLSSLGGSVLTGVKEVAVGENFSCAIITTGKTVKCWGENSSGQLGNGTTTDSTVPAQVKDSTGNSVLADVTDISLGKSHACARVSAASGVSIQCWGSNAYGQIGNDSLLNRALPTVVSNLSGAALVWVGSNYSCAKLSSSFRCWGQNDYGQLGIGNTTSPQKTSQSVTGILAGSGLPGLFGSHACATDDSGGAYCWGRNNKGQLGNGNNTNANTPAAVTGMPSGISSVTGGSLFSCSLSTSGAVKCWGDNTYSQLGNSGAGGDSSTPVAVSGLASGVLSVSSGTEHSCAVLSGDLLRCWGRNQNSQLGDGGTQSQNSPVLVNLP